MSLRRNLSGYVLINASGTSVGRFFNLCVKNDIPLWGVRALDGERYRFFVAKKDVWRMRPYLRKTHTRVRIGEKHGLPFVLFRYRRRILFPIALAAVTLLFGYASRFVWKIEINGNSYLTEDVLISYLEKNHAAFGDPIGGIDCDSLELSLRQDFAEVIWASVSIEGTDLIVELQEKVALPGEDGLDGEGESPLGVPSAVGTNGEAGDGRAAGEAGSGRLAGEAGSGPSAGDTGSGPSAGDTGSGLSTGDAGSGRSAGDTGSGQVAGDPGRGGSDPAARRDGEAGTGDRLRDNSESRDLVAEYDAVIDSIITRRGTPKVRAEDEVKKGEVLVAGESEILDDAGEVSHRLAGVADADVVGKVIFPYEDTVPVAETVRERKREKLLTVTFDFFGRSLTVPLGLNPYEESETLQEYHQLRLTHQFYLPVGIALGRVYELVETERERTDEEALAEANRNLERYLARLAEDGVRVTGQDVTMKRVGESYQVQGTVTGLTDIGRLSD